MKILVTTIFAYPPQGGLGVYIKELKEGLEQNGHTVHVLARHRNKYCITKGNRQYELKSRRSSRVFPFWPALGGGGKVKGYLANMREEAAKFLDAVEAIDLKEYQIIHAQDIVSAAVLQYYKPSRVPHLLTVHGCVTAEYYYSGFIKPKTIGWKVLSTFESSVIRSSSKTIVPSQWLVGVYKQCEIPTGNMTVIPNGINVKAFERQMRKSTGLDRPKDKSLILCTGRLVKVKGQHVLLDALAQIKNKSSNWECWIVGKGEEEADLKKQAKKLGLNRRVKFLGRREDIPALLKQADIVVIPSLQDNYPYSLIEAQVAGKAVIASNAGGITEMVNHGKTGILVPPGNSEALSQQLSVLLDNKELQEKLGSEAQAWGKEHFSLEKMTKKTEAVYRDILKSRSRGRSDK